VQKLPFSDPLVEDTKLSEDFKNLINRLFEIGITLEEATEEIEKLYISMTLKSCGGNRSRTARKLGIHRNTLISKIEKYKLDSGSENS